MENLLGELILKGLTTGALGGIAWLLWNMIVKKWPKVGEWPTKLTRPVVYLLCAGLTAPVFAACVAMLWLEQPTDWRGWVSSIGGYALLAWFVSQEAHAIEKDRADKLKGL